MAERQSKAEQRRQLRALQRDLTHKEKALAETAPLLVLSQQVAPIWADEDASSVPKIAAKPLS